MSDASEKETPSESRGPEILPAAINRLLAHEGLLPTPLCVRLFNLAAQLAARKKEAVNEVSCTGVFFSAVTTLSPAVLDDEPLSEGDRLDLRDIRHLADIVTRNAKFAKALDSYYRLPLQSSFPSSPNERDARVRVSTTLANALAAVPRGSDPTGERTISARTLLTAVLSNQRAALRQRLTRIGLSAPELVHFLSAQPPTRENALQSEKTGFTTYGIAFERDPAGQELSLGTNVYSAAIATLLRTAEGEFCFGLFGPWGVGKTSLSLKVAPLLISSERYVSAMNALDVEVSPDDPAIAQRYDVVRFSAWTYRRIPEAWIFLYETLADQCLRAINTRRPFLERLTRTARTGVARHGYWPLIFGLLALGVGCIPVFALVVNNWRDLWSIIALIGFGGIIYFVRALRRGRDTASSLGKRYASLSRHGDQLGMQGLIGDALRALMVAWIPGEQTKGADQSSPSLGESGVSEVSSRWDRRSWLPAVLALSAFAFVWLLLLWQIGTYLAHYLVLVLWIAAAALTLWVVHRKSDNPDRILVVVDDLDRCAPAEIIDLIDSLKLLLEDPIIQKRVQIMMLVDEDVLDHAIAEKFANLIEDRAAGLGRYTRPETARSDVVHEHTEKLFACHLRLPAINSSEIGPLITHYAGVDNRSYRESGDPTSRVQPEMISNVADQVPGASSTAVRTTTDRSPPVDLNVGMRTERQINDAERLSSLSGP
jgi:hypothetical protein